VLRPIVQRIQDGVQREVSDLDLECFRCELVVMLEGHREQLFPSLDADPVRVERGRKYARVWKGTSCYAFVELSTGDILKPASWREPAKHARGNIFNPDALGCCGPYGVAYMT